jgi:hypothetical protein
VVIEEEKIEKKRDNGKANVKQLEKSIHIELMKNLYKIYISHQEISADEIIIDFMGRCSFQVHIVSKPNDTGMKTYAVADKRNVLILHYLY